jgi:hypothetical protein
MALAVSTKRDSFRLHMNRAQLLKPIGGRGAILESSIVEVVVVASALRRSALRDGIVSQVL